MRNSETFGLLNLVDHSDEKIKSLLPEDAWEEIAKANANSKQPASFLVSRFIETVIEPGQEFTVNDIYILIHQGTPKIAVKMSTLRSVLSTLSKKEGSTFTAANSSAKHRLYVKV